MVARTAALVLSDSALTLVGHSHVALQVSLDDRALAGGLAGDGVVLDLGTRKWLLNPGSVGQPRDRNPDTSFAIVDSRRMTAQFFRVPYDVAAAQSAILKAGLPVILANRLKWGT